MNDNDAMTTMRLTLAYLAEQPIIHTEDTIGNLSKIKKMRVMNGSHAALVPALSGNSFRGQLRDILADQMFSVLSDSGKNRITFTNNDVYGAVYSGGALGDASKLAEVMKELTAAVPMLRVMGAAFGNTMWPSKLAATHIIPCTQETRSILLTSSGQMGSILASPDEWPNARDLIFNDGPLTRKDDRRDPARQRYADPGAAPKTGAEDRQQMIYDVECIAPGTWLVQQLYTKYPLDTLELGCLFDGLQAWLQAPSLGGRSAAGYGQVRVYIRGKVGDQDFSMPDSWTAPFIAEPIEAYGSYLADKQKEILAALKAQRAEGSNAAPQAQ